MAIKELITLEGVEEIEAKLARLNKAGEESLGTFRDLGREAGTGGFDRLVDGAKKAGLEVQNFSGHTKRLGEAFHVLRPILQASGVQFAELGGFARLAGASFAGLGVALTGAVAVGLGKFEESIAATKGRLSDLLGSSKSGEDAFRRLEVSARSLGTTTDALEPSFEALKKGLDNFAQATRGFKFVALTPEDLPQPRNIESLNKAIDNFFKILRAGRLDSAGAAKASQEFFTAIEDGGFLTAEILKKLPSGTIQLLAQAMGRGAISVAQFTSEVAKAPIPIDKLATALANFGPQADKAFDTKAIITMGDAVGRLFNTFNDFIQKTSGLTISETLIKQIELFRSGFVQTVAQLDAFITKAKELGSIKFAGIPLLTIEFDTKKTDDAAKKAGEEAAELYRKGFRTAPAGKDEPVPLADIVTIDAGSAADVVLTQFKEHFAAAAPATWEPLTRVPPFDLSVALASFQTGTNTIVQFFQDAYTRAVQIWSQPIPVSWQVSSNPFLSGQPTELASGGMVRGRGSTTSDSILAWLSNREFVVNARAVSHYGPDLFATLNAMRLPKDFISRFSMGGLARALSTNKFAAGGQVSTAGNRSLTLVLDQKRFSMSGSKQTIDDLEREASLRGLAMIGKAPSWIR